MNEWWSGSILALYYLVLGILACYGVHRLALVITFWRTRRAVPVLPEPPERWQYTPSVQITRELFEERMFPLTLEGLDRAMRELQ